MPHSPHPRPFFTQSQQASLPESPRWLLLNGAGREEAVRALVRAEGRRASNLALVEAEIDEMATNLRNAEATSAASGSSGGTGLASTLGLTLFQEKRYSRPLLVGMSLMLFQQVGRGGKGFSAEAMEPCGLTALDAVQTRGPQPAVGGGSLLLNLN